MFMLLNTCGCSYWMRFKISSKKALSNEVHRIYSTKKAATYNLPSPTFPTIFLSDIMSFS